MTGTVLVLILAKLFPRRFGDFAVPRVANCALMWKVEIPYRVRITTLLAGAARAP